MNTTDGLREIGRIRLLTAAQEVELGRRIEKGQMDIRRVLAAVPMALRALVDVGDEQRLAELGGDGVIRLADAAAVGTEHTLKEVGKRFALTRERIRQIEAEALRKLRYPLRATICLRSPAADDLAVRARLERGLRSGACSVFPAEGRASDVRAERRTTFREQTGCHFTISTEIGACPSVPSATLPRINRCTPPVPRAPMTTRSASLADTVFITSVRGMPRATLVFTVQPDRFSRRAAASSPRRAARRRPRSSASSSLPRIARTEAGRRLIDAERVGSTTASSVATPPGGA